MGELVARNMVGWFENINKRKVCCILLVVFIVELMMHGHTNIKSHNFLQEVFKSAITKYFEGMWT